MPPWAISSDLKLPFLFFVMYKDFPPDKPARFSAPEHPLYTKLYSSDKLLMFPTQIHTN
ncbi:hypothetical protein BDR04DRAFT_1088053 [Suillus decipiens]|nr:hypothetical protein BDR04DRAFT_1088053 [Suillus decipiens]